MEQTLIGQILALGASLCGASSSLLYNRLGKKAKSYTLACVRMFIAVPIILIWSLLSNGLVIPSNHDIIVLLISGIIGFFITDLFLFKGYVAWGPRQTMVVMCLSPVLSAVLAFIFMGEKLSGLQITGIAMTLLGVILMVGADLKNTKFTTGALIALAAAIFQSISDITAKSVLSDIPWLCGSFLRSFGGVCCWIVWAMIKGKGFKTDTLPIRNRKTFALLFITVMLGTVLGTSFSTGALKFAPAGIVSSLKQTSSVFILLWEVLVMHKKLTLFSILGTLISVAGVFLLF